MQREKGGRFLNGEGWNCNMDACDLWGGHVVACLNISSWIGVRNVAWLLACTV